MQMLAYRYYDRRILYYGARLHQQQLHEGEDYRELKPERMRRGQEPIL
jgi:hypothetical protein